MEPYSQFLKRAVAKFILLSVSVFSLLFSHSTLLTFLHYFNFYYILNLPLKLFSHTLDKNCTFLFCNGLLVFLANYSGLFSLSSSSSSSSNKYDNLNDDLKCYEDDSLPKMPIMETTNHPQVPIPLLLELEAELENTQTQPLQNAMQHESRGYKEREAVNAEDENSAEENLKEQQEEEEERAVFEEDKDKAEAGSSFFIEEVDDEEEEEKEEEEEEGGGGNDELSKEELNKRCDDFIRKMKEDIRMEARQQLILV